MDARDFQPGDRVRVTTKTLENGRLLGKLGTVQEVSGDFWPVNVIFDEVKDAGHFGTVPFGLDEIEHVESEKSDELKAIRNALHEEEKRSERFARQVADSYSLAADRLDLIRDLESEKEDTRERLDYLREENARSELAVKLWKDACTKAETELEELKQALTTLAS